MPTNIDTTLSPEELKILGNKYYSEKKYEYIMASLCFTVNL